MVMFFRAICFGHRALSLPRFVDDACWASREDCLTAIRSFRHEKLPRPEHNMRLQVPDFSFGRRPAAVAADRPETSSLPRRRLPPAFRTKAGLSTNGALSRQTSPQCQVGEHAFCLFFSVELLIRLLAFRDWACLGDVYHRIAISA